MSIVAVREFAQRRDRLYNATTMQASKHSSENQHDTAGNTPVPRIQAAEVVLPCTELDATLEFFTDTLGFSVEAVFPADNPRAVVISGYGVRIRLQLGATDAPGRLRLLCGVSEGVPELQAPNGTRIELVAADPTLQMPPLAPSLVVTRLSGTSNWITGRAGMRYRDLIPGRQGGRFIASHIQIPGGGPVPDYVHYHKVRVQMIYCYKGWVKVVYQDQGPPFVLHAGDCVLQPPRIRHRVLESSPGLEVIEISSPAEHETFADRNMTLPTTSRNPQRDFSGQVFVHHVAREARWKAHPMQGFEARDIGIAAATKDLADARVLRVKSPCAAQSLRHQGEFRFLFVLQGSAALNSKGEAGSPLGAGDCCVIPPGEDYTLEDCSASLQLLQVRLPVE